MWKTPPTYIIFLPLSKKQDVFKAIISSTQICIYKNIMYIYIYSVTFVTFFEASGASTKLTLMCCVSHVFFILGSFSTTSKPRSAGWLTLVKKKSCSFWCFCWRYFLLNRGMSTTSNCAGLNRQMLKIASIGSSSAKYFPAIPIHFSVQGPVKKHPIRFSAFPYTPAHTNNPLLSKLSVYNMPFLLERV